MGLQKYLRTENVYEVRASYIDDFATIRCPADSPEDRAFKYIEANKVDLIKDHDNGYSLFI